MLPKQRCAPRAAIPTRGGRSPKAARRPHSAISWASRRVNLTRLKPGAASALRHWHEAEDEFVYVLEGEILLIEDGGTTVLEPGDAAGFKAGVANGHHLVNKSKRDAVYLEVGTRAKRERAHYPDVDLVYDKDENGFRFSRRSGEPYPKTGG